MLGASAIGDEVHSVASEVQTVRVSLQTPNPCWEIRIASVYATDQELLVVSELQPPGANEACIQTVGQAEDEVSLQAPAVRVKHLVLGRTWDARRHSSGWGPDADYLYPKNEQELAQLLKNARRIQ